MAAVKMVVYEAITVQAVDFAEAHMEELCLEVTMRRNALCARSQIADQLGTPLMTEKKHTISFVRAQVTSGVITLIQLTFKAFFSSMKASRISEVMMLVRPSSY